MGRFCYCSTILPNKSARVRTHWKKKESTKNSESQADEISFWNHLKMTGFECWLQPTLQGDFMIHCLEGESLKQIFKGLREQIAAGNRIAIQLRDFYLDVLGKDYGNHAAEPHLQDLSDFSLPTSSRLIKRAFLYPLLPHKEADHLRFRQESMGKQKARHEAMMRAFGVSRLSTWLQSTPQGKYIIIYTDRHAGTPATSEDRLKQGADSSAWEEIAAELCDHTGLKPADLSPDVEWLTAGAQ